MVILYVAVSQTIQETVMSIYLDKFIGDVMSYNSLTTVIPFGYRVTVCSVFK